MTVRKAASISLRPERMPRPERHAVAERMLAFGRDGTRGAVVRAGPCCLDEREVDAHQHRTAPRAGRPMEATEGPLVA